MSTASSQKTDAAAVLGTGTLGSRIVEALLLGGHPVHVWNRTRTRVQPLADMGACREVSPSAAIRRAGLVITTVSSYDDVRTVLGAGDLTGRTIVNFASGTPELARGMARWVNDRGGDYLDGAAMSGTRLIGDPRALFLYAGDERAFRAHEHLMTSLGTARYLGHDPATAAVYDAALLTMNLGLLAGAYHGMALTSTAGVDRDAFASIAASYLPFAVDLMVDHAQQADEKDPTGQDGSLDVYREAIQHIIDTSLDREISPVVPRGLAALVDEGIAAGRGAAGLASLIRVISRLE